MSKNTERRQRRSSFPRTALAYQLEHCVDLFDVETISLADERGLLVAASEESPLAEVVAAYAPLMAARGGKQRARAVAALRKALPEGDTKSFSVRQFRLHGQSMYVCAVGRRGVTKDLAVRRVVRGTQRILAEPARQSA